jgi:outer membrane protein assembly factor BamB
MITVNNRLGWEVFSVFCLIIANTLSATDWSSWLGPKGDNTTSAHQNFDPDLSKWTVAWKTEVGRGYSTITTHGNRAFTKGHDEASHEAVYCFDIESGQTIWRHSYEAELMPRAHGGGPNASVVIDEDRVYATSKDGQLHCLRIDNGEVVWMVDLPDALGMDVPSWGFGSSPVIYGDQLLLGTGRIVSFDKMTGKINWVSETERRASYGTPVIFTYNHEDFIAAMHGNGFFIVKANSGEEVTEKRITTKSNVVSNTPFVFEGGERIFIHTNAFSEVLRFDGTDIEIEWIDRKLQNSQTAAVMVGGVLYGLNGLPENDRTRIYARNPNTGEAYWSIPDFGFGSLIAVDETLLILTDHGELVTATANLESYQEISRRMILEPTCWTKPIYANGRIFARNDAGQVICLVQD